MMPFRNKIYTKKYIKYVSQLFKCLSVTIGDLQTMPYLMLQGGLLKLRRSTVGKLLAMFIHKEIRVRLLAVVLAGAVVG